MPNENDNKLVTLADLGAAYTALSATATTSANGMMSSADKTKLDGLTPASIGAVSKTGDTITGELIASSNDQEIQFTVQHTDSGKLYMYAGSTRRGLFSANANETSYAEVLRLDNSNNVSFYGDWAGNAIPIDKGGSGQTSVSKINSNANNGIAVAGDGFSITSAQYAQWGKMAMVAIKVKRDHQSAVNATTVTACTITSGKRPAIDANITSWDDHVDNAWINTAGDLRVYPTNWTQNTEIWFYSTYILA